MDGTPTAPPARRFDGKNTCSSPNLTGIGKIFRPVVIAPPDRAIIELDYKQMDVGILAGESGDEKLIEAYNSGDIYDYVGKRFYGNQYDRDRLRPVMKETVLSIINNKQPKSIAKTLKIPEVQATALREGFLDLFPGARQTLEDFSGYGQLRGYASTVTGLNRHVDMEARKHRHWMQNFLRNTPIQGSAADIFKKALIDLDHHFAGTDTWIILPVHDAVVLECDWRIR